MQKRDALGQRQACAPQPARHAAAVQDGMGALNFIYNSIGLFYNGHCIIFFTRLRAAKASGAGDVYPAWPVVVSASRAEEVGPAGV